MPRRLVVVCTAVAVLLACGVAADDAPYTVQLAQIVHHHGVGGLPLDAQQAACGTDHSCGSLTAEGVQMLSAVGSFVRARYNDPATVAQPFFVSRTYNASAIHSLSADLVTAVQSANAFLQGLFPSVENSSPAVFTANHTTDARISADGVPSVWVKQQVDAAGVEAALRAAVDERFTDATVQQLAAEAQLSGACADGAWRVRCVLRLYNAYLTLAATSRLASTSLLRAHAADLTSAWANYTRYLYGYNATNPDERTQGAAGQFIARELLQNMRDSIAGQRYRAYHYSADATLLAPLALTLGLGDAASLAPAFGTTILVELLQRSSDKSYHVRVLRGVPERSFDGSYTYSPLATTQTCTRADGTNYTASDNICPLDDFARYINVTREAAPNGHCVLPQPSYALLQCPTSRTQPLSSHCAFFRELCPASACPAGYALSAVDERCYKLSSAATGEYVVRLAQVVHRHGARNPLVDVNKAEICGTQTPCSYLTNEGIQMLLAVGTYMRSRYNNVSIVEQPFFESQRYDPTVVYSRSTSTPRTLQSGSAFLHGLFPDGSAFIPAIFTDNFTTDTFLNTDPMPAIFVRHFIDSPERTEKVNSMIDKLMTWDEITAAAPEAYWAGGCSDYSARGKCLEKLQDIAFAFAVTDKLASKPHLSALLPKLKAYVAAYWHYVYDYNASDPIQRKQGSKGYTLMSAIIGNMRAHLVAPSYKMYHYSTHDTMLAPMAVTMGDTSDAGIRPPFSAAYAFELLQDTGDGSYHVRTLRGYAEKTSAGAYAYADLGIDQHCMRADGTAYVQSVCPLDDFVRFIDSSKPTDPAGVCIISDAYRALLQCPTTAQTKTPLPHFCALYRTLCPTTSCAEGYVLSAADLQCYAVSEVAPAKMSAATTE